MSVGTDIDSDECDPFPERSLGPVPGLALA